MRRSRPKSSILLRISGATTLLLQHSCGFVFHRPPSAPSSIVASSDAGRARVQLSLANAKRSGDDDYDYTDGMADSALYKDLQQRIQELGLDGESTRSDDDARSGGALAPDVEIDEEKEYVYIGGERFYIPSASVTSSSSSSRSAPSVDQGEQYLEYLRPPSEYDSSNGAVSSRREVIDEARPSIIGSLEGLAITLSLFFAVTVAATGGSLFASNANISTGSTVSQRVILDPDALLKEDFARDGSSVFYGQIFEE